jgi:hypothetical protein
MKTAFGLLVLLGIADGWLCDPGQELNEGFQAISGGNHGRPTSLKSSINLDNPRALNTVPFTETDDRWRQCTRRHHLEPKEVAEDNTGSLQARVSRK